MAKKDEDGSLMGQVFGEGGFLDQVFGPIKKARVKEPEAEKTIRLKITLEQLKGLSDKKGLRFRVPGESTVIVVNLVP
jgi:hypothetical protein